MREFHISNTLISKLAKLNTIEILVTTKCKAGYLVNDTIKVSTDYSLINQLLNIITHYKSKVIFGISVLIEDDRIYTMNVLNCYSNGNVALIAGDFLEKIYDTELRHGFKNAEDMIAFKSFYLVDELKKVKESYN
jgi:hypothetical protein